MKKALNAGCGNTTYNNKEYEWTNLDIRPLPNVHIIRDIKRGIPVNDKTFDLIVAFHFIEHFEAEDLIFIMDEFWRVLKDKGILFIETPTKESKLSWIDPAHKQHFVQDSLNFFVVKDINSINSGVNNYFKMLRVEENEFVFKYVLLKDLVHKGEAHSYQYNKEERK